LIIFNDAVMKFTVIDKPIVIGHICLFSSIKPFYQI